MSDKLKQCGTWVSSTFGRGSRCQNRALPGKGQCGVHDPQRAAERQAKRGPTKWEQTIADTKASRDALAEAKGIAGQFATMFGELPSVERDLALRLVAALAKVRP